MDSEVNVPSQSHSPIPYTQGIPTSPNEKRVESTSKADDEDREKATHQK